MSFNYYLPSEGLRPYVRHYWSLRRDYRRMPLVDRSFPTGCIQLTFHRGKPLAVSVKGQLQPTAVLTGQCNYWDMLSSDGEMDMLVCVFRPCAAGLFFGIPMSLIQNVEVSLADLEDAEVAELGRRVSECRDDRTAIGMIERFLCSRLATADEWDMRRMSVGIRLIEENPSVGVERLAAESCLCRKSFERLFLRQTGTTPAVFRRVVRFHRALHLLALHRDYEWARLAYAVGYADQSHLIREFRRFTGYTPEQYLRHYAPYSDYFQSPLSCKCLISSI